MFRWSPKDFKDFLDSRRTAYANCSIEAYTGAQPADVSLAPTGTLLGRFTLGGLPWAHGAATNGLNFDVPVVTSASVKMTKVPAEDWRFKCDVAGTIGWCRIVANPADAGAVSLTNNRIDISVGISSGDLQIPKLTYAIGEQASVTICEIEVLNAA